MAISYLTNPKGIDIIPNFLSARTAQGLRRAMLKNNTINHGFVVYQDIQWVSSDKKWYAWFYIKSESNIVGD